MRFRILLALLILSTCVPAVVSAQVFYDEATDGDLGDPIDPAFGSITILGDLGVGVSTVDAFLSNDFDPFFLDRDAFTFTVAEGVQLDSLSFTSMVGGGHFYALSNQDAALATTSAGGNYYAALIGDDSVGVNLLDGTVNNSGGAGGSGPLAAGDYTFWFQETDFSRFNYSVSLTTSVAVPEPSSLFVLLCGGGLMCLRRRRRTDS